MEVRAGYKQTEVGVIPEDWGVISLSQVCEFITKGSTPTTYGFKWESSGVVFLRSECISENGLDLAQSTYISPQVHRVLKRSRIQDGDILITITGNVGRVVKLSGIGEANINQHIARVRISNATIDSTYVCQALSRTSYRRGFETITTGQAYPQLSLVQVRNAKVALPSTEEQRAIATALSDVDSLMTKLDQLITKKSDIKKAAMQELLTGKRRLPGFSGEWESVTLGDIFSFSGGYSASREQLSDNGYCYLHYGDIHLSKKTYIDTSNEYEDIPKLEVNLKHVSAASLLNDGDVVFVDASEDDEGVSKHVVVRNKEKIPFISGLHTIVAKSKGGRLDNNYKMFCFQTQRIKDQFRFFAVGTKVSGISKSNIVKIVISVPHKDEQQAIAQILSDMDEEIAKLQGKREKTAQIKQGMMQYLLTGAIRLT